MTDNFEQFKFYEATPSQSLKQNNPTLLRQCKNLIKELHQQLIKTTNQLERKNAIIEQLIGEKNDNKQKNIMLQKNLEQTQKKINQKDLKIEAMTRGYQECQQDLKNKEIKIQQFNREFIGLQNRIHKLQSINKNYLQNIQQLTIKISLMEQTIQLINNQNCNLSNTVYQQQQQSNWQILQLKKYNQDLRKKAVLYQDKSMFQTKTQNTHSSPIQTSQKDQQKRAVSTGRKNMLYDTTDKPTNQLQYRNLARNVPTNFNFVSHFNPNPQMGKQLHNLKQQISRQYTNIQVRKQGINHERVTKTIAELEKKIGKMVSQVQKSDSESFME